MRPAVRRFVAGHQGPGRTGDALAAGGERD